jgi:NADPH:quinone reductase-like Zn-dependent oxidoreductase
VKPIKTKNILLTGGASGIGTATARLAVERGHNVLIADVNGKGARSVALAIGKGASAVELDVTNHEQWEAVLDALEQRDTALKFTIVHPTSTETPMLQEEARSGLALAFANPSMTAECTGNIILDGMEKQSVEIFIPKERGRVVRRIGTSPRALREMVIRGEARGAERLRTRLAAKA